MQAVTPLAIAQPIASRTAQSSEIAQAVNQVTYARELIATAAKLSKSLPAMSPRQQADRAQYILELVQTGTKLLKQSSPALISAGLM